MSSLIDNTAVLKTVSAAQAATNAMLQDTHRQNDQTGFNLKSTKPAVQVDKGRSGASNLNLNLIELSASFENTHRKKWQLRFEEERANINELFDQQQGEFDEKIIQIDAEAALKRIQYAKERDEIVRHKDFGYKTISIQEAERNKVASMHKTELQKNVTEHEGELQRTATLNETALQNYVALHDAELQKAAVMHEAKLQQTVTDYDTVRKKAADKHHIDLSFAGYERDKVVFVAQQLQERDKQLAAAAEKNDRLTALLNEMETKLAAATAPSVRYVVDPVSKKKLADLQTKVPDLEAKLADTEMKLAATHHHHQLALRELEQQCHYVVESQRMFGTELLQNQQELLLVNTQHRAGMQQLEGEKEKVRRMEAELEQMNKKLAAATQGCEGSANCTSCTAHLLPALRIARAYEQEAVSRLEVTWVEKMRAWEEIAILKSGLASPPVVTLVKETEEEKGLHDSDSGSDSETSDIVIIW